MPPKFWKPKSKPSRRQQIAAAIRSARPAQTAAIKLQKLIQRLVKEENRNQAMYQYARGSWHKNVGHKGSASKCPTCNL